MEETKYTIEDMKAIELKAMNPKEKVICPRCGKELIYQEIGYSSRTKCETDNCLIFEIRGL